MQVTYYGRFHGPETGRIYAEIYKSSQDDGLTLDERVRGPSLLDPVGCKAMDR